MTTSLLITVLTVLVPWFAAGQEPSKPTRSQASEGKNTGLEQALDNRIREYNDALKKRDLATLDKIWAPDYTLINPRGELVAKAQRMANLKSGATEFQTISSRRDRLHVQGNVAIDIGRVILEGTTFGGQESSGEYRYTIVWVDMQGRWQMLATQITLIAK